jgi:DNA-binding transcriptional LysR family regulator
MRTTTVHNLPDLDLNLLVVFDAMLRECNVTQAAQQLGLTQSAMSHSLKRLRDFFDDPLFVKSGRGMSPTAKAQALEGVVMGIMASVREQVISQAQFDPATAHRSFTLCLSDMGELVFAPSLYAKLKVQAPHCTLNTIQVSHDAVEQVLSTGKADLAVGAMRSPSESLYQQELFTHTFATIVSVRNKEVGDVLSREQFETMPHIATTLAGTIQAHYENALHTASLRRNVKVLTPHYLLIPLFMDQHPELIATVPRALGNVFSRHGLVRLLEPPLPLAPFSLRQYWHPRFHHDRANIWLRTLMRTTFDEVPSEMRAEVPAPHEPDR